MDSNRVSHYTMDRTSYNNIEMFYKTRMRNNSPRHIVILLITIFNNVIL